jgi:hypothetical protein
VNNNADGDVVVVNNLIYGRGDILEGAGMENNNLQLSLSRAPDARFAASDSPEIRDRANRLPPIFGVPLTPVNEFNPPVGIRDRTQDGALDIGSREFSP